MSRHLLSDILTNEEFLIKHYDLENGESEVPEPEDLKGYGLSYWLDECLVGWDPGLETYFLQCIELGHETLEWWIGTSPKEITEFDQLTYIIESLFNHQVEFEFVNNIQCN